MFVPDSVGDFLGDELFSSEGRFMVEEDSAGDLNAIGFSIIAA